MASHHVLFSGDLIAGADPDQVQSNLARELGLPEHKARALFSGRTVVIKSQLGADEADALVKRLADLGAVCRTKDYAPKESNPARYKLDESAVDKTLRDLTAAHVECPRCGNMQLIAEHCSRCGVDIEAAMKQRHKEDAIIEKKIRALKAAQAPAPVKADAKARPQEPDRGGLTGWLSRRRAKGSSAR